MKNLFIIISSLLATSAMNYGQTPARVDNWPYLTVEGEFAFHGVPRFSRILNFPNGSLYFNTSDGDIIKFHLDKSICQGWPISTDTILFGSTPIITDLDHDDCEELITKGVRRDSGYLYSLLYIVDDDGEMFPGFPMRQNRFGMPNVADFDNDGEYELIFYSTDDGLIYCIDAQGDLKPGWPIPAPDELYGSASVCGSVGDLDNDGGLEFVLKGQHNLYAYRYDGTMQNGFPIHIFDDAFGFNEWWGVTLGDIDNDGFLEIAVSGSRRVDWVPTSFVAIYENSGQMKDGWPRIYDDMFAWQMPTIADINGDGQPELGITLNQQIYFIDINGNNLPGWPTSIDSPDSLHWVPMSDLICVDINGDGDCEIFGDFNVYSYDNSNPDSIITWSWLFAADHEGNCLPGYPVEVRGYYLFIPPTFGLDDETNRLYMSVYTQAGVPWEGIDLAFIELYQFPDSTGPANQWPMLCHDNLMTRNYNFVDHVTAIREGEEPLPRTYVLKQNYPNPFNASTKIEFDLPKSEQVSITIFDILGREVEKLVDTDLPAGHHELAWQADGYASGMYFCVMRTPRAQLSRKMVLLK